MSQAIDYLQARISRIDKEGDKHNERADLVGMITAWELKEVEAQRLSEATGVGRFLTK